MNCCVGQRFQPVRLFLRSWLVLASILFLAVLAQADDGYWAKAGGGSWTNPANWDSSVIADGTDNTAYFGLFSANPPNAIFTLDIPRTIGHLYFADTQADNWALSPGTGGQLTLDATFDNPSITVVSSPQVVTINTVLAGTNGLEKLGAGTVLLAATNTYAGATIVSSGSLRLNGLIGMDGVTVAGGALTGAGVIQGPVTIQNGGTLSPANSLSALTISNDLALMSGSTTRIQINAATSAYESITGLANVTYGGSLVISNLAGTPALGQTFPIFNALSSTGNFSSIAPNPGAWLRWKFDPASGVLAVVSAASQPRIFSNKTIGTNLVLQVTNGPPGATVYLLASTNVTLPRTNWMSLASTTVDAGGNFTFTNAVSPTMQQRFYVISLSVGP